MGALIWNYLRAPLFPFTLGLTLVLVILRIVGVIEWHWAVVLLPLIITGGILVFFLLIFTFVAAMKTIFEEVFNEEKEFQRNYRKLGGK